VVEIEKKAFDLHLNHIQSSLP